MARVLIDTNVLVYAYDRREASKQRQAIGVLEQLQLTQSGYLSVQTLAEFYHVVRRGSQPLLSLELASQQARSLSQAWPVFDLTAMIIMEAVRGVTAHRLAYWDAQIWATARLNQIPIVFTEDFPTNALLEGVRIVNPFAADFDLSAWA
jgi:predicted nucleic acid-binding protein